MEVQVITMRSVLALLFALSLNTADAAELSLGPRVELKHPGKGHETHVSGAAVAIAADGVPLITWAAQ